MSPAALVRPIPTSPAALAAEADRILADIEDRGATLNRTERLAAIVVALVALAESK